MRNAELNCIRALKDDAVYLILVRKFDRQAIDFLYCTLSSSRRPEFGESPHRRSFDSFVLRRALAQEPLREV